MRCTAREFQFLLIHKALNSCHSVLIILRVRDLKDEYIEVRGGKGVSFSTKLTSVAREGLKPGFCCTRFIDFFSLCRSYLC